MTGSGTSLTWASMRTLRAAMLTRIESSVARTASLRSMGSKVSDSLPDMSWLASSRSPSNWVCARALRSMTFRPSSNGGGIDARPLQQRGPAEDGIERRAQLVGDGREEFVLGLIGGHQLAARGTLGGQQRFAFGLQLLAIA